jgi:hypothetical protein
VRVGDMVLTHKNRFKRVTEIMRRQHEGDAYRVWLVGCSRSYGNGRCYKSPGCGSSDWRPDSIGNAISFA